jgi:predicted transcriptional regulator
MNEATIVIQVVTFIVLVLVFYKTIEDKRYIRQLEKRLYDEVDLTTNLMRELNRITNPVIKADLTAIAAGDFSGFTSSSSVSMFEIQDESGKTVGYLPTKQRNNLT